MYLQKAIRIATCGKPKTEAQRVQAIKTLRLWARDCIRQGLDEQANDARKAALTLTRLGDLNVELRGGKRQ